MNGQATLRRDIVVIGGSAGSVEAVITLARGLPADFPASIFLVIHRGDDGPSLLAELLDRAGPLPAVSAEENQPIERGTIYVVPVDRHLLVGRNHMHVRRGPRENRMRPAVDPLFRSAAAHCSTRVIGVVLSGNLDDGTAGLRAIKRCGGIAVVQQPDDAACPSMPMSALEHVDVDHVVASADLPELLVRLVAEPRPPEVEAPRDVRIEALIAAQELTTVADQKKLGKLSPLTCPECHGVMYEITEGNLIRYRCHTGHAFTLGSMRSAATEAWEKALYEAMRAQQEQVLLMQVMAESARKRGRAQWAATLERRELSYQEGVEIIRQMIAGGDDGGEEAQPD